MNSSKHQTWVYLTTREQQRRREDRAPEVDVEEAEISLKRRCDMGVTQRAQLARAFRAMNLVCRVVAGFGYA